MSERITIKRKPKFNLTYFLNIILMRLLKIIDFEIFIIIM